MATTLAKRAKRIGRVVTVKPYAKLRRPAWVGKRVLWIPTNELPEELGGMINSIHELKKELYWARTSGADIGVVSPIAWLPKQLHGFSNKSNRAKENAVMRPNEALHHSVDLYLNDYGNTRLLENLKQSGAPFITLKKNGLHGVEMPGKEPVILVNPSLASPKAMSAYQKQLEKRQKLFS